MTPTLLGFHILMATYSSLVSNTTIEGVIYSVQLDDTVVDCWCASMHGLSSNGIFSYVAFASSCASSGVLAGWCWFGVRLPTSA